MGEHVLALALGFALDALLGDPAWLLHPVCIIGSYISFAEKRLRARGGNLRKSALLLTVSTVLLTMAAAGALLALLGCLGRMPRLAGMALLDWLGLAMTSLAREARGVERALERGLEAGRAQVARIVGRDTQRLSEEEIVKATVETVAENTTDGVIAPMLYAALGGPVLGFAYKAVNTMDSMVGYKNDKYMYFGRAAAKLDDVVNYIPSRISAGLMILSAFVGGGAYSGKRAWMIYRRDRRKHASPNSAQTESVCAGALGIRLAGNASYFGKIVEKPYIGDPVRKVSFEDIRRANDLMYRTAILCELLCLGCMGLGIV